jgi:uncharacterized repeat protein (TIGR01451 family)
MHDDFVARHGATDFRGFHCVVRRDRSVDRRMSDRHRALGRRTRAPWSSLRTRSVRNWVSVLAVVTLVAAATSVLTFRSAGAAVAGSTTAASSITKTGTDLTTGSTATAGGAAGTANPGDTIKWVVGYQNKTGSPATTNITDPITGDQTYVPGSLQVPPSLAGQWSTNGGTSYASSEPAAAVNAVGATGKVTTTPGATTPFGPPIASLHSNTSGGDGWQALSYNGNIYLLHHHYFGVGTQLDCYNPTTGVPCPGYIGGGGSILSTAGTPLCTTSGCGSYVEGTLNWSYIDQSSGKLYFAASIKATKQFGIGCFDLSTNTSCGFYLNYTGSITAGTAIYTANAVGLANIGTKLYELDSNGYIDCFDISTSAACSTASVSVFPWVTPTTAPWQLGYRGETQSFGSSTYVWATSDNPANNSTYLGCLNVVTNTACFTPVNTGSQLSPVMAPVLNSSGTVIGACLQTSPGTANAWTCWNTSGAVMSQSYAQQATGFVGFLDNTTTAYGPGGVYVTGTKVYMAYNNYTGTGAYQTYTCWDWSLNSGAGGSCAGFTNPTSTSLNGGTAVDVAAYTINSVNFLPGCLAEDGDAGILQFFDAITGGPCTATTATLPITPASDYCDGASNHVTGWNTVNLGGISSSQYSGGTYTVYDSNGNAVPGFSNVTLSNTQQSIDISSIPYSGTTTSLRVVVSLSGVASGVTPTLTVTYKGDPMQVCYETTIPNTCVAAGTTAPNTANVVTTGTNGVTDSPAGASSGAATFTITSPASACSLNFTKTASKQTAAPGDTVTYTVSVSNTGTAGWTASNPARFTDDLTNVLTDATYNNDASANTGTVGYAAPVLSWSGALAAGASATITYSVKVNNPDTGNQKLANTVVSTNPNTNCASGSTDPRCSAVVPLAPNLNTTKSIVSVNGVPATSSTVVKAGDVVVYGIVTVNGGGSPGSTTLSDPVPANTVYSGSGEGWSCAAGSVAGTACTQSVTVAGGATVAKAYTVTVVSPLPAGTTQVANTVASSAGTCSSCTAVNPAALPGISVVKSASPTVVSAAGQAVTYTFVVTNDGKVSLGNVNVTDVFTTGGTGTMTAISCQSLASPAGSCSGTSTSLAPGQVATFTATYTVTQADVDAGKITNAAIAHGTPSGSTTPIDSPPSSAIVKANPFGKIGIVKTAHPIDRNGDGTIDQGDQINWTFVVTNLGDVTLTSIVVSDPTAGKVSCPSTSLAPGKSMTCTAPPHAVTAADAAAGHVANVATASGHGRHGELVTSEPAKASVPIARIAVGVVTDPPSAGLAFTGAYTLRLVVGGLALLTLGMIVLIAGVRRRRDT